MRRWSGASACVVMVIAGTAWAPTSIGRRGLGQTSTPAAALAARSRLDAAVQSAAEATLLRGPGTVGVTVAAVHGTTAGEYAFGRTTPAGNIRPTSRTIFPIGSISKTFAGVLLARAVVDGRARLTDDVRRYLEGAYPNLAFDGQPLPLYTLLNHRSGLPRSLPAEAGADPQPGEDVAAWVRRTNRLLRDYSRDHFLDDLHGVQIAAAPNTQFAYSNAAAQLLGFVIERVYGSPLEVLLRREITEPLGMVDTAITLTPEQRSRHVVGFEQGRDAVPDVAPELGLAGALYSTASDMLRYVEWHMREGDPVSRLSHQATFADGNYAVGLNWQMLRGPMGRVLWQDGTVPGATALCLFEPESRIGLVVLMNSSDPTSARRLTTFANRVLSTIASDAVLLPIN